MRDPQVVGMPTVVITSLTATGTPASGPSASPAARRSSTSAAAARAPSPSTCRKAWTASSTAAIRSRCASVTSTALTSPAARAWARSSAERRTRETSATAQTSSSRMRGTRKRPPSAAGAASSACIRGQARGHDVGARDVGQRQRVAGGRHIGGGHLRHVGHRRQDDVELAGQVCQLVVGEVETGQASQVGHLVRRDRSHGVRSRPGCGQVPHPRRERHKPDVVTWTTHTWGTMRACPTCCVSS